MSPASPPGTSPRRRLAALAIVLATLAGGALRFYGLGTPGLWLDEILMYDLATQSKAQPWHAWLTGLEYENGPLYLGSLLLGRVVPGANLEASDRFAAAVAGTLTIPLVGIAGALAAGPLAGGAAAWLLAVAPFHVYYSREGRPYALLTLVATLALLAFLARGRKSSAWLGGAVAIAAPYLAVSAFQVLAAMLLCAGLCAIVDRRPATPVANAPPGEADRRRWLRLAGTAAAGLLLYALLYGHYPRGSQIGDFPPHHARLVVDILDAFAASALWRAWGWSRLTPVYAALALAGLVGLAAEDRRRAVIVGGSVLGIAGFAWLGMQFTNHFFTLRYFTPALPAYLVLAGCGIAALARGLTALTAKLQRSPASAWTAPAIAAALTLALVAGNAGNALACPYLKAEWRSPARWVAVHAPKEPVLAANGWTESCLGFYLRAYHYPGRMYRLSGSAAQAEALATTLGRCWVARGGYPESGELRRWMRDLDLVFRERAEGIALYHRSPE